MRATIRYHFSEKKLNDYIVFLIIAFVFFMNVSEKVSTLLLVTLFILSLVNVKQFNYQKFKPISFLVVLLSIYILTHILIDDVFSVKTIEKRVSLLALPIVFSIASISEKTFYIICKFFVYGVILGCILNLLEPFVNDFNWDTYKFLEIENKKKIVFKGSQRWMNHFYSIHFSNFLDRSYYGVYLSLGIAIIWHILSWKIIQKIALITFFIIHIFLSNSLMGILGLGTVFFFAVFNYRRAYVLFLLPLFFIVATLISSRFLDYISQTWTYMNGVESIPKDFLRYRWEMWKGSVELISEQPLWGYGKEGFDVAFNARMHKNVGWSYNILDNVGFNSHNQYLQVFGEAGIFGFLGYLVVIAIYIINIMRQRTDYKYLKYSFIFLILIFSCSESILNRYFGISFFTFFYCFFLVNNSLERKNCYFC
ncbi:MAG: hypothetical protein COA88_08195 [Kordia sp.]|nr:MAG: hypothetical protein COA88_08195 [Kordia sp.]